MLALSGAEFYVLCVSGTALLLIVSDRLPPDLIALLVLLALGLPGIVSPAEALAGFSSPAVLTLVGLFIITSTLERTGVILWVSGQLARLAGATEARLVVVLMGAGALLSLVVNNVAAGAVLLPAALRIARQAEVPASRVALPLAFGTLVGGMATLFTTANILLSANLQDNGLRPLTMLDFLGTGGIVMLAGITYMALVGRRLLPRRAPPIHSTTWLEPNPNLPATYQISERLWEVLVLPGSALAGLSLNESGIGTRLGITVLAILRDYETRAPLNPQERIEANDVLLVLGNAERVHRLATPDTLIDSANEDVQALSVAALPASEVIIAPRAPIIGRTLTDLRFRSRFDLTVVAIWRGDRSYRTDVGKMTLQAGDALLVLGARANLQALAQEPGYIVAREDLRAPVERHRWFWAAGIALVAIGVSAAGWIATPAAMLLGAALLVLSGCIRMHEAYSAVEWRIIFLIAGMAPLSSALEATGLTDRFGSLFLATFAPLGALGIVAGFYLLTFLVVQVLGGQVTALVVGPLAVTSAIQAGVNPHALAVAVAIACSASFLTPVAHPVNMLMVTPGGYSSADFLRVGSGMALVCFVALMVAVPLFWPL